MRILSAEQIRSVDQYTIDNTPISSVELMEQAGVTCTKAIVELFPSTKFFTIFCGTGNNGGDGLVIARHLIKLNKDIRVLILRYSESTTQDFNTNLNRLKEISPDVITDVYDAGSFLEFNEESVFIDAIFGTGLSRKTEGLVKNIIQVINSGSQKVVSVDLPTGLFAEDNDDNDPDGIVHADYTLSFEIPKLAFFFSSNNEFLGELKLLEIGLYKAFIDTLVSPFQVNDSKTVAGILKIRSDFAHKGNFGHALLICGSYGKIGAAVLSARSCIRSGAGLLTVMVPKCGYEILQTSVPEAMVKTSESENIINGKMPGEAYSAIGIGPGIGTDAETINFLERLFLDIKAPLIMDADALNSISARKQLMKSIPVNSILTPHPKEFERLFGDSKGDYNRLQKQRSASVNYSLIIVLKGRYTSISFPDGSVIFNSSGNPGMATAGSGDVLTGILAGLSAQGYSPNETVVLGVYLHGLAGDLAKLSKGEESMMASDIIENLGNAFIKLHSVKDIS